MDQCDSKINPVKYVGSVTYISWSIDFALYHCHRLKLFLYIKKWHPPGVFVSLRALALVQKSFVAICNEMFRAGAKTLVGSGNLKHISGLGMH